VFFCLISTTYIKTSASDITTLPTIRSNIIFQEVGHSENSTLSSSFRKQALYSFRYPYKFQTRKMTILAVIYDFRLTPRCLHTCIYKVSQEECARLREGVPYVKVYRYDRKHLCPNLNGYGDNGQRSLKL